jgi:serine/threonine protein kinase/Tol biopolymer transport system component
MPLSAGTRLGPYEIGALIGSGGMGRVYRAHDTKLRRDVALKILPDAFAHDRDRLARLQREAHVLASLNHPNVAQIYGLEEASGVTALVMELVDGPTLADLIAHGQPEAESVSSRLRDNNARPARWGGTPRGLEIDDALAIARQIAGALEAAHEQGIVHRDLKPANVKVKADGTVKVLDFGLAKALDSAQGSRVKGQGDLVTSPTITSPAMTEMGMILGTAAYMAPEQARGRPVDKRVDIWAFGCVLFEMLTGRRVFEGEDISLTLSQVLQREPDWTLLPASTPARIRRLLERCLYKDPARRLRDIGEARIAVDGTFDTPEGTPARAGDGRSPWRRRVPVLVGALGVAAVTAAAGFVIGTRSSLNGPSVSGPPWDTFTQLTDDAGEETSPTLSPDGSSFAYASRARGTWDIHVQRVGGRTATLIAGDVARDEASPAFSPDGTRIAFHESDSDGGIFIVGATGESPRRLTSAGFHPGWSPDGRRIAYCDEEILTPYNRGATSAIWIANVDDGSTRKIFDGDGVQPVWSPTGERLAFWSQRGGQRDLFTIGSEGGASTPVTNDAAVDWIPTWAPDGRWLLFASDRGGTMNLWRVAVDEASGQPLGAPEPVTLGVQALIAMPTFSRDGTKILFQSTLQSVNPAAISFDPQTERVGPVRVLFRRNGILGPTSVSPDGQWLALANVGERQEDIFTSRIDGSGLAKLTDDPSRDRGPRWSPEGTELAFYSNRTGNYEVWIVGRDGARRRQASAMRIDDLLNPSYGPRGEIVAEEQEPNAPLHFFDPRRPWTDQTIRTLKPESPAGYLSRTTWSPDGRRLASVVRPPSGRSGALAVIDLQSEKLTAVDSDVPGLQSVEWLSDSRRVVAAVQDGLVLYDVDSRRRRELSLPSGTRLYVLGPAVAPDDRTIYVGVVERESDIWMVERSGGAAANARK